MPRDVLIGATVVLVPGSNSTVDVDEKMDDVFDVEIVLNEVVEDEV